MDNPLGKVPGAVTFDDPSLAASLPTPLSPPPPPQQQPPQPQVDPQQMAQMADTVHHAGIGKAFRSLMGNEVNYSIGPDGKLVQTETPRSGSNLWRSMLAGVLLGGATASKDGAKNFVGGAAEGGAAVVQHGEQQDQLKRAQAGQDFKTQMEAQANQRANRAEDRADKTATSEDTLRKATIAAHNAHTLHENQTMQRENSAFHEEIAAKGKVQLQPYLDAGLTPVFKDKGESEMNDLMKNNADAAHLLWEPTGTRIVLGADGTPNVEATYSAVNPTGKIKLTDAQIKQFKDAGIDQYYGKSAWDVLKAGKELDATQYMALTQKEQELTNKKNLRDKQDLDLQKEKAAITLSKAEASHYRAVTNKIYTDEQEKKLADQAQTIAEQGGDLSKVGVKGRKLAAAAYNDSIKTDVDVIKSLRDPSTGQIVDQNQANSIYKRIEKSQALRDRLLGVKEEAASPTVNKTDGERNKIDDYAEFLSKTKGVPLHTPDAYDAINSATVDGVNPKTGEPTQVPRFSESEKAAAIKKYAVIPWKRVIERSEEMGITPDKMADKLKAQGFRVGQNPWAAMVTNPELKQ
jgi:hypothetical protein